MLGEMLQDLNPGVRDAAIVGLLQLEDPAALPRLRRAASYERVPMLTESFNQAIAYLG